MDTATVENADCGHVHCWACWQDDHLDCTCPAGSLCGFFVLLRIRVAGLCGCISTSVTVYSGQFGCGAQCPQWVCSKHGVCRYLHTLRIFTGCTARPCPACCCACVVQSCSTRKVACHAAMALQIVLAVVHHCAQRSSTTCSHVHMPLCVRQRGGWHVDRGGGSTCARS
jgi:hypothetical protein